MRADGGLAGVGAGRVDARVERHVRAEERVEREGAQDVGRADGAERVGHREPADGGHELRAVDEGEALLRLEGHRLEAGGAQGLAAVQDPPVDPALALAHERQREVGERGEVAARAHGPL